MNLFRRATLAAILIDVIFAAGAARAGDITGKVSAPGLKSPENIAVYIDAIAARKFEPPAQPVSIDQRNMKFTPRTTVILRGTTVEFLNSDQVAHSVYWSSIGGDKKLRHSMTIISPDHKKPFKFDNLGSAQLLCNLHPEMVGYVLVVPTAYFALTAGDGTFTIKNVPAGTYILKSWSEDGKPTSQTIVVADAGTKVELTVTK
jgi:plastocyanin